MSNTGDRRRKQQAIKYNEALKEVVKNTVQKLRNPRMITYDIPIDVPGTKVIKAACEQANVEGGSVTVKFPIKGKETTHCVLEANPSTISTT